MTGENLVSQERSTRVIIVEETSPIVRQGSVLSLSPLMSDFTSNLIDDSAVARLPRSSLWLIEAGAKFAGEYGPANIFFTACGMNIVSGYAGLVTEVGAPENWNEGKGGFVTIERADILRKVTYTNLRTVNVKVGDFMERGQILGAAGQSGHLLSYGSCQVGIIN